MMGWIKTLLCGFGFHKWDGDDKTQYNTCAWCESTRDNATGQLIHNLYFRMYFRKKSN